MAKLAKKLLKFFMPIATFLLHKSVKLQNGVKKMARHVAWIVAAVLLFGFLTVNAIGNNSTQATRHSDTVFPVGQSDGVSSQEAAECDVAKVWFKNSYGTAFGADSFQEYTEDRIRFGEVLGMENGKPRIVIAIQNPKTTKIKAHSFLLDQRGKMSSQLSMTISKQEWSKMEKIDC
ncbi:hypothetical protein RZ517_05350 [Roseovarius sp. S88]|uniref:Uncharacterized protein n=1 Tax=Roseovarius phycicola TaxID=3080976 RepID=A0ABZ2HPP6_9RHOB